MADPMRHGNPSLRCSRTFEGNEITHRWDSWADFVADVEATTYDPSMGSSAKSGDADFCETASMDEALTLAREGWSEKRGDVSDLADKVKADPIVGSIFDDYVTYPTTYHSVTGAFPDVAAFLAGDPECMIEFGEMDEPRSGRAVRIHVDIIASGGTQTDVMVKRGAVVVALVELLETLGFTTEVWLESRNNGGAYHHRQDGSGVGVITDLICAKTAGEPLDVDGLMFAIANPSTLRRLLFRWWEGESATVRKSFRFINYGGYGHCDKASRGKELDAHVTLTQASAHNPETMNPAQWIREIVTGLFTE